MRDGIVVWFDDSSGEGMVADAKSGKQYYLHYSAIESDSQHKTVSKGDKCRYRLYTNSYMSQIDRLILMEEKSNGK